MEIRNDICPICNSETTRSKPSERDTYKVNCPRCGYYEVTDQALTMFQRSELADIVNSVSYWIRQHQSNEVTPVYIDLKLMRSILETPFIPPKPNEQANRLLQWIGENVNKPDAYITIPISYLISVIGAVDEPNVVYIADYLKEQGYIRHQGFAYSIYEGKRNPEVDQLVAQITFKGWERFDEIKRTSKVSRLAFMAMKFGNETLVRIFNEVIKDAVSKTGFEIRRLDEERRAGLIDDKLRVEIRKSKFLVADLTDDNNGAYWEAGYAEGLGMPVIYICEEEKFKTKLTHFDTNHHLTVRWKNEPDSLKKFAEELKATIRATFPTEAKMED